jgi:hypothetical protein
VALSAEMIFTGQRYRCCVATSADSRRMHPMLARQAIKHVFASEHVGAANSIGFASAPRGHAAAIVAAASPSRGNFLRPEDDLGMAADWGRFWQ